VIEYRGVHKSFGPKTVLNGVNLAVPEGQIFFVLGKTGAGKTVMIRMLVGLVRPDAGAVLVDGEDVARLPEERFQAIRRKCGMVFQLPTLFDSMTVYENVAFGLRRLGRYHEEEIAAKIFDALEKVELGRELAGRAPGELSFGEQKRVGLARTLVLSPRYLLYDEPTTGLDPFTASRITALIRDVNKSLGTTSIVVSHDLESMAEIADRVGLLWDGGFRFLGTVPEFLNIDDEAAAQFRLSFTGSHA